MRVPTGLATASFMPILDMARNVWQIPMDSECTRDHVCTAGNTARLACMDSDGVWSVELCCDIPK